MGRQYEYGEWLEFLMGNDDQPEAAKEAQEDFQARVEELVDLHLPDDQSYPDLNEVSYLSFASLNGEGVGLWEKREEWHGPFDDVVNRDRKLSRLYYALLDEVAYEGD